MGVAGGAVSVVDSSAGATTGSLSLTANGGDLTVTQDVGKTTLLSAGMDVSGVASGAVGVTGATLSAGRDLLLRGARGDLNEISAAAAGDLTLDATTGDLTLEGSSLTAAAGSAVFEAPGGDSSLTGGTLVRAGQSVTG